MYSIPAKTAYIASIMERFGYTAVSLHKAETREGTILWLDGLSGFTNGHKFISFVDAQRIARSITRLFKQYTYFVTPIVVSKHLPRVTCDFVTGAVRLACVDSTIELLRGDLKGIVYSHRKGFVIDHSTGQSATIIERIK